MKTCLNRLIGRCHDCDIDYSNKYPNNMHCSNYREINLHTFEVREQKVTESQETYVPKINLDLLCLENAVD